MKIGLIFFIILIANNVYAETSASRWDAYFKRKLFDPPAGFVQESLKLLPTNNTGKVALDLGSGVGHETLLLLKKGYRVVAVDYQKNSFEYLKKNGKILKYKDKFTLIISSFEKLNFSNLPKADIVVASFSLPFVSQNNFHRVWSEVVSQIKPGGYFIGNFFNPDFTFFENKFKKHMTFHTKEETLKLFNQFKIIYLKEINTASLKPGAKEHYYIVFGKKK